MTYYDNDAQNKPKPPHLKLRKLEKNVLIPRHMEARIIREMCLEETKLFHACIKENNCKMWNCRPEQKMFEECTNKWMRDKDFRKQCEKEYLELRQKYKETGVAEPSFFKHRRQ